MRSEARNWPILNCMTSYNGVWTFGGNQAVWERLGRRGVGGNVTEMSMPVLQSIISSKVGGKAQQHLRHFVTLHIVCNALKAQGEAFSYLPVCADFEPDPS